MDIGLLSLIGILLGLVLLVWLSFKGMPLVVLGPLASALVLLFSGEDIIAGLTGEYATAFAGFAQKNFLLFLPATILGAMLGECGAANDIAVAIARLTMKAGKNAKFWTLMGLSLITMILVLGGVSGFVIIFTITPICVRLFKKMDIPWHLVIAVVVYGGTMFTAVLPGSPAIQNLIPIEYLGTNPMSAPWIGIIVAAICAVTGAIYIKWILKRCEKRQEGFMETGFRINEDIKDEDLDAYFEQPTGSVLKAVTPSLVLLITMNVFGWRPELALFLGVLTCAVLYWNKFDNIFKTFGDGGRNTATAIINVCAVVGFGGIIKAVPGFEFLVSGLDKIPGPPLIQLALATNLIAGITGSASGGEGIALEAFADRFLKMGIDPHVIHRVVNVSCYGLDSLPHNGSVINRLLYTKLTHKEGYYHEFILGAIIPFFMGFVAVLLAELGIR